MGIILHFVIALGAATVYYIASRRFTFLLEGPIVYGIIYGALVYLFMHMIVLPVSNVSPRHVSLINKLCEFVEHWFCVGLPISISVRHYS